MDMENTERREFRVSGAARVTRREPADCVGPSCAFEPETLNVPHTHDHSHGAHGHAHSHDHAHETSKRRLLFVLSITAAFMIVELIGGLISNSLALIADSAHMLTDVGALGLH